MGVAGWSTAEDEDLLVEARRRQSAGISFSGLAYAHQLEGTGECVGDLELIEKQPSPRKWRTRCCFFCSDHRLLHM